MAQGAYGVIEVDAMALSPCGSTGFPLTGLFPAPGGAFFGLRGPYRLFDSTVALPQIRLYRPRL
jgi:hypothetical protein